MSIDLKGARQAEGSGPNGNLVPLVGAGISRQAKTKYRKAFPTWTKLLSDLNASAARKPFISADEKKQIGQLMSNGKHLMAAQALKSKVPKDSLDAFIAKRFLPDDAEPAPIHRWLFRLKPQIILTTNYDLLLEDAYAKEYSKAAKAFTFSSAPAVQCSLQSFRQWVDRPIIFKLHGSADSGDAVLGEWTTAISSITSPDTGTCYRPYSSRRWFSWLDSHSPIRNWGCSRSHFAIL